MHRPLYSDDISSSEPSQHPAHPHMTAKTVLVPLSEVGYPSHGGTLLSHLYFHPLLHPRTLTFHLGIEPCWSCSHLPSPKSPNSPYSLWSVIVPVQPLPCSLILRVRLGVVKSYSYSRLAHHSNQKPCLTHSHWSRCNEMVLPIIFALFRSVCRNAQYHEQFCSQEFKKCFKSRTISKTPGDKVRAGPRITHQKLSAKIMCRNLTKNDGNNLETDL